MREFYSLEDSGRSGFLAVIAGQRDEVHGTWCMHVRQVGWLVDVRRMKRRRGWESCVCVYVYVYFSAALVVLVLCSSCCRVKRTTCNMYLPLSVPPPIELQFH